MAAKGKQAPELLVVLRRVIRHAKDWGVPTWPVKLDVRKAFDSVGGHGCSEGGRVAGMADGMPWEARAWLGLLEAREVRVAMQDQLVSAHAEMACGSYCVGADDYLTPGTREHLTSFLGRLGQHGLEINPAKTAKGGGTFTIGGKEVACRPFGEVRRRWHAGHLAKSSPP